MRVPVLLSFFSILISMFIPAAAQEPVKPQLNPKIMTATRQVTLFTNLENQLLASIQKKDELSLKALLTDDFEIWMPGGDPVAGEDWISAVMDHYSLKSFRINQMSVRDFGDISVVNFVRTQRAEHKGKNDSGEYFVVDIWRKDGGSWKLSDRYVSKVNSAVSPVKPTGKQ